MKHFAMSSRDNEHQYKSTAWYTSTEELTTTYLEEHYARIWGPCRGAGMDFWLRWVAVPISLDDKHKLPASIPAAGDWFLLTRKDCKGQSSHNDPNLVPGLPMLYCMIATCRIKSNSIWVCSGLFNYVLYDEDSKLALALPLKREEMSAPWFSVIIGNGYFQRACPTWEISHCLRYNEYIIRQGVVLGGAIAFPASR